MPYEIVLTPAAVTMLGAIKDRRVRQAMAKAIDGLADSPDKQGKPLTADLTGLLSHRAVGQRYRIIYRIDQDRVIVLVVAVGLRKEGDKKDIYALAKKLVRLGLIEPPRGDAPTP